MKPVTEEDKFWYEKCLKDFPEEKRDIQFILDDESNKENWKTVYEFFRDFY